MVSLITSRNIGGASKAGGVGFCATAVQIVRNAPPAKLRITEAVLLIQFSPYSGVYPLTNEAKM